MKNAKRTPAPCRFPECPLDHCACGLHSDASPHLCHDPYAAMSPAEIETALAVSEAERLAGWDVNP